MKEIKEYLEQRLKTLDYELGYFEDDDDGNNLSSAKRVKEEITEVKNLLVLFQSSLLLNNSFKKYDKVIFDSIKCRILLIDYEKKVANIQNNFTKNVYISIPLNELTKIVL